MTIYIDIVLIENLCMNYIILVATGLIIRTKLHHIRMILSALIGGIYAILSYMQVLPFHSNMAVKIILSICMVYIAFSPKDKKAMFKYLIMFYLVSFVFGGCAFALLYFVKPEDIFMINGVYIGTYPVKIALLGGIVGFVITYIAFKVVKSRIGKKSILYDIEIKVENVIQDYTEINEKENDVNKSKVKKAEDKIVKMKAMLDTGNKLREPITGAPVIVVEKEKLSNFLPKSILENTDKIIGGDWSGNEKNINYQARFRVIPFTSIGKQNGMLLGFKVDEVKVIGDVEEIINQNVIVCLYNQKLSKTNTYSALIGLDMLEGREENELITNIKV